MSREQLLELEDVKRSLPVTGIPYETGASSICRRLELRWRCILL